jgi:trigger factor
MKVRVNSKKGLKTILSVLVDKKTIQKKLDEKLHELQHKVDLKGFRPGKVPANVIKNQFGKAIYGEVIDGILKETSAKAIEENKIKVAGQPKIDLKTFGEGKDLDYTMELETLPEIKLKSLDKINATDYEILVDKNTVDKRVNEIAKGQQNFSDKKENEKSEKGDMIIFDYKAKAEGKDFEGNEGKNIQLILGRDLFIKGFDDQLLGVKKNENKSVSVKLPENYPKKELVNKKTNFNCKIINLKKPVEIKIDDEFAKKMGAKDIVDLKSLVKNQISKEYKGSLDSITKKNILEQIEKSHSLDLPPNLIEQEIKVIAQSQKKEDIEKNKEKNTKLAKSRIKIGLILNEIAEKNNLKISENEIKNEIEKQVKQMPGQEKMVMEYYQKNPSAIASLRGALYEEKILELIKNKIKLSKKSVTLKEAEQILKVYTQAAKVSTTSENPKKQQKKSKIKKKK